MITETDDVARALDDAARQWPEDRDARARLILRLVGLGHETLQERKADAARRRREAVRRTKGMLTGVYGPDYLSGLREDWPE
jgi:hypothetical protein